MGFLLCEVKITDEEKTEINISTLVSELTSNTLVIQKLTQGNVDSLSTNESEPSNTSDVTEAQKFDSLNHLLVSRGRIENQRGLLDKANLVGRSNTGAI